ncbi:MAG: LemA family protein [Candidatus Liptonbacteria bacterium]|nr:LemA family protein [Candidatus Liptonbacteria bacterium]
MYILIGILVLIVLWFIFSYNGFVRLSNRVKEAWSDIEVQLKRRYDLIPNLVATVKGYASHESGVFEKVTEARTRAMGASSKGDMKAIGQAENQLAGTLKTLFAVSENYPQLRASENFRELQNELTDTEDKIQASRRFYNGNVRDFNTKVETFPSNLIANMFHFAPKEFFDIDEKGPEGQPVAVKF